MIGQLLNDPGDYLKKELQESISPITDRVTALEKN